jgi:phage head maturation protease
MLNATATNTAVALMMEAAGVSGTSVNFCQAARRNNSDDSQLQVQIGQRVRDN